MTNTNDQRDQMLEGIAQRILNIPTPATLASDRSDFHEVATWSLREALRLAYSAGYEQAVSDCNDDNTPATD